MRRSRTRIGKALSSQLERENVEAFDDYKGKARRCEIVVGQGSICKSALEVQGRGYPTEARLRILMNCVAWLGGNERETIPQLRAASFANPATLGAQDILMA